MLSRMERGLSLSVELLEGNFLGFSSFCLMLSMSV